MAKINYDELIREFRLSASGDSWGDVMGSLFRVCDSLVFHHGIQPPDAWGFRPSPLGRADDPAEDYIAAFFDDADPNDLLKFGTLLERASGILKARGLDY